MTRWLCRDDRTNAAIVKERLVRDVPALSFTRSRVVWSGSIHGAMRAILEKDDQRLVTGGV